MTANRICGKRDARALLLGAGLSLGAVNVCQAAITPDGTMGSVANLSGQDYSLSGGTQSGGNLFHSFSVFDIHTGETATFNGPAAITNIISRVTGGTASSIDGVLGSAITGANLYLVNPAGVMFGPNASLNVDGSFHVSTADYLVLGATGRFDASNPGNTVLTTAPPSAFGYLSANPAPVTLQGSVLQVSAGESLSVVAGDVTITDAALYASEGTVNIASVAAPGEVVPTAGGPDTSGFAQLGDIRVTQTTFVSQRPTDNFYPVANIDASGNGGGEIYIRGEQLVMDNGYVFADTRGNGGGGRVDVAVRGDVILEHEARITADTGTSTGSGGDIAISADNVTLRHGGQLSAATYGPGTGGNIVVDAASTLALDGKSGNDPRLFGGVGQPRESAIVAETFSTGQSGTLTLNAAQVTLANESLVSVSAAREGDAGSVSINAGDVTVSGGSGITSDSSGSGSGGSISVNASGTVRVAGALATGDPVDPYLESSIRSNAFSSGGGGSIDIDAGEVRVTDRGVIQANLENNPTFQQPVPAATTRAGQLVLNAGRLVLLDGGQLVSANVAGGTGGDITLDVADVSISGQSVDGTQASGIFSVTASAGPSGDVALTAGSLAMDDLGSINTSTIGDGAAGAIHLRLDTASLQGGARVSSSTGAAGNGGRIDVDATGAVRVTGLGSDGFGSGFYSDVQAGPGVDPATVTGTGGNIVLVASDLLLSDSATVSAKSTGFGDSGTIDLRVNRLSISSGAQVRTSTAVAGQGGDLSIATGGPVTIAGESTGGDRSGLYSSTAGSGAGGNIDLVATDLDLDDHAIVTAESTGTGDAGTIDLRVNRLSINSGAQVRTSTAVVGQGGDLIIATGGPVTVAGESTGGDRSGLYSSTAGNGAGGNIDLAATGFILDDHAIVTAESTGSGDAGAINLRVDRLSINNGAQVRTSTAVAGQGGGLTIATGGPVTIAGESTGGDRSGLYSSTAGSGSGGRIDLAAIDLSLDDHALVTAESTGTGDAGTINLRVDRLNMNSGAQVRTSTAVAGQGGDLSIAAGGPVTITGESTGGDRSGLSSSTAGSGSGGNIGLTASNLLLNDRATVSANSTGAGDAGSISIDTTDTVELQQGASITTQAVLSGGGRININTSELLYLNRSSITSSVQDGSGNGGDITIDPQFVVLLDSQILAQAFAGNGGNITITAGNLFVTPDSVIDASSQLGIDGNIVIDSPDSEIIDALAQLPEDYLNVTSLLRSRCSARSAAGASSLVVQGRGGLPPTPAEVLATWDVPDDSFHASSSNEPDASRAVVLQGFLDGVPALLLGCTANLPG